MADPTGLVSLGLGVAKKAVKHGSTVRSRQRRLKALPYAVDMAFAIPRESDQPDDPVTKSAHQEVLIPCIFEAEQFLGRVEGRNLFASTIHKIWSASDDDEELRRLLSALERAPARIDARILELRVSLTQTQQHTNHKELVILLKRQQSDMRSVQADVARYFITIISDPVSMHHSFPVAPYDYQDALELGDARGGKCSLRQ